MELEDANFFSCLLFIYLFLAVLGLCCCVGFSLVVVSGGYSLVAEHRLQATLVSVVVACGLSRCGFQAVEHRLSSWSAQA